MQRRRAACGVLIALAVWLAVCAGPSGASARGAVSSSATSSKPVTVPVHIIGGQGSLQGARPVVAVKVGNGADVPVLLDTGSSGLRIFDTAVPSGSKSGVAISTQPSNIRYAGGHRFTGVVATASITIGSQRTARPVRFGLVQNVSCARGKPKCPAAHGMAGFEKYGGYGILGIGTESSGGGIVSPLLGMPGALGDSWSLHLKARTGQLILGASLPRPSAIAATLPMKQIGAAPGGRRLWGDDRIALCLTIGSATGCAPGLLDSGTYTLQAYGQPFDQVPTVARRVQSGIAVSVRRAGAKQSFWRFSTGSTKSKDLVTIRGAKKLFINTGVQTFFDFIVTYSDLRGTVVLARSP
jgi:hypothetical protein